MMPSLYLIDFARRIAMQSESELRPTHDSVVTAVRWRRVRRKASANLEG
jgi:hypothetical protein